MAFVCAGNVKECYGRDFVCADAASELCRTFCSRFHSSILCTMCTCTTFKIGQIVKYAPKYVIKKTTTEHQKRQPCSNWQLVEGFFLAGTFWKQSFTLKRNRREKRNRFHQAVAAAASQRSIRKKRKVK